MIQVACKYADNYFCKNIVTDAVRPILCAGCQFRSFAKGQLLTINYWSRAFTVLADGLLVVGYQDHTSDKLFVTGIASSGGVVGAAKIFPDCPTEMTGRIVHCVTKCTTAVFNDYAYEEALKDEEFANNLVRYCFQLYWYEKEDFIRAIGSRDTTEAVRYIVKYCTDHGIPALTHEQIALMCNRARPTVTNILHELTLEEPSLFQKWNK